MLGHLSRVCGLMVVAGSVFAAQASAQGADPVRRETSGARATELLKMELKPFDAALWGKLSEWKNGAAISSADTQGKVVLVCTWADWAQPSVRALNLAVKLAEKHGKDGLILVAVHDKEGWKDAKIPAVAAGVDARFAYDSAGEFRKGLMVDQDPDFYLIDRAGQLRYADVLTDSVTEAVELLVKEKADDAAGVNERNAKAKAEAEAEARRTEVIRQNFDLTKLPELPFPQPAQTAYEKATWPKLWITEEQKRQFESDGSKPEAKVISIPDTGWWPKKPNLKGRVIVAYIMHPDLPFTYDKWMDEMDKLQVQRGRDVCVVGVVVPLKIFEQNEANAKSEANDPDKLKKRFEQFGKNRKLEHVLLLDTEGVLLNEANPQQSQGIPIPYHIILSTEGALRYFGWGKAPEFAGTLDAVIKADPAVQARRKVEDDFIRKQSK
jgi:hypothetical protein